MAGKPRDKNAHKKADYINEHELAILLSCGRNFEGDDNIVNLHESYKIKVYKTDEDCKEKQDKLDALLAEYDAAFKAADGNKLDKEVQRIFKLCMDQALITYPTDKHLERLYVLLRNLSERCLATFGRTIGVHTDEFTSILFERWIKYRYNFDPSRTSKISGSRVNAFAYMTQVAKNVVFEIFQKNKNNVAIEGSEFLGNVISTEDSGFEQSEFTNDELFETREILIKEATKCLDFEKCLRRVKEKHDLSTDLIIETIMFFDMQEQLKTIINQNRWDF